MLNYRPTWAEINKSALLKNVLSIKGLAPPRTKILAVVKANAYGHDSVLVSKTLESHVYGFGVATVEEGLILRESGIRKPIMVLGPLWPFSNFAVAARNGLVPTVSSMDGLNALSATARRMKKILPFCLKIDTGMGRIGLRYDRCASVFAAIAEKKGIRCVVIYSHFSSADSDRDYSAEQLKRFLLVKKTALAAGVRSADFSLANSAGLINLPASCMDMVRPGISLYGLKPFDASDKKITLYPALTWKTRVVFLKRVPAGTPISYSRRFVTKRSSVIATLPVGYADGYRLGFTNNSRVLIRGVYAPVVGRVTMDMIMTDVTGIKNVSVGDEAVLLGFQQNNDISAEELAKRLDTINYEITCGISYRVPRVLV